MQSNRSFNYMVVGDYNFQQGSKFNPYAGIGIGLSIYDNVNEVVFESSGKAFVIRPRVGIELFHHLRLSAFSTITHSGHSNFGLFISGVIGGRPKK